jgi:hypothetical protein
MTESFQSGLNPVHPEKNHVNCVSKFSALIYRICSHIVDEYNPACPHKNESKLPLCTEPSSLQFIRLSVISEFIPT